MTNDARHWLLRDLPYAAMLALAVGGIVLTSFRGPMTYYYWMALAPIYGLICVISGWRRFDTGAGHMQLAVTQVLHWLAFVGAMWLMFLPEVRGVVNDNATSLTLLILLALGTFVAGVHARVWRICAVGVFLAASVPAVAWVQESAMLLLIGALLLIAVGLVFWWMWRREWAGVSAKVVLWSDYVSPYAFVAKARAYELEADYDLALEWRPYTLDIASFQGSVAERDPHHWRRVRYAYMDARRYANKQGLTLMGPKKIFYARPGNAGMLYARKHGVFRAYNDRVFDRFWRRELDPENPGAVAAVLVEAGAPAGFEDYLAGEGGAEHDRLRLEAENSGVFGVPTFAFDGELFWGGDRIGLLRERLDEKGVKRR